MIPVIFNYLKRVILCLTIVLLDEVGIHESETEKSKNDSQLTSLADHLDGMSAHANL